MNICVGGVIEIQTTIIKTASSCGSEIYCACSSIIHKGTQKIWSDFNKDILEWNNVRFLPVSSTCIVEYVHVTYVLQPIFNTYITMSIHW